MYTTPVNSKPNCTRRVKKPILIMVIINPCIHVTFLVCNLHSLMPFRFHLSQSRLGIYYLKPHKRQPVSTFTWGTHYPLAKKVLSLQMSILPLCNLFHCLLHIPHNGTTTKDVFGPLSTILNGIRSMSNVVSSSNQPFIIPLSKSFVLRESEGITD